jgi:hypothetical protein
LNAEAAVRDQSLSWPWQVTASIRVAIDRTVGPVELFTIHDYWTNVLRQAAPAMLVLADVERLVTSAWRWLAEQGIRLRAPGATAPALLQACDSVSRDWKKVGEVLVAACDAVPAVIPEEIRRRLRSL